MHISNTDDRNQLSFGNLPASMGEGGYSLVAMCWSTVGTPPPGVTVVPNPASRRGPPPAFGSPVPRFQPGQHAFGLLLTVRVRVRVVGDGRVWVGS